MKSLIPAMGTYALASTLALVGCGGGSQTTFTPLGSAPTRAHWVGEEHFARAAAARYELVLLPGLGGNYVEGEGINNRGWIEGNASLHGDTAQHAVFWTEGRKREIGTLGGPNTTSNYMNEAGEFSGGSEIPRTDPHLENFCGIPTGNPTHLCRPFHWQDGRMTQLPTLGGNNGMAFGVNSLPQVIGFAETGKRDSSCVAPQVFDFKGVIWQSDGTKVTLPPYPGDTVSLGFSINDEGQAVGSSGTCGPVFSAAPAVHALLWRHRKPVDLGNLGAPLASASHINNRGQVVGVSGLAGSGLFHAFLWQKGVMKDLGALPGGVFSNGTSINERGQVVGFSADASGNNTAFIWEDGTMKDLNRLVHASSLHLMIAADINDHGWITGDALDAKTGKIRGVLLIPIDDAASTREGF